MLVIFICWFQVLLFTFYVLLFNYVSQVKWWECLIMSRLCFVLGVSWIWDGRNSRVCHEQCRKISWVTKYNLSHCTWGSIFHPDVRGGGGSESSHQTCHEYHHLTSDHSKGSNMCNVRGLSVMCNLYISSLNLCSLCGQREAAAGFYRFPQLYQRVNENWHLSHLESLTFLWQELGKYSIREKKNPNIKHTKCYSETIPNPRCLNNNIPNLYF